MWLKKPAEDKMVGKEIDLEKLHAIIQPFITHECDTVVLGCTHFPHLKEELISLAPQIQWIDSGQAIARQTKRVLNLASPSEHNKIVRSQDNSWQHKSHY
ncbi:MAG: aspartate/glutamate racemase family protein [Pseudomonadota bacterium]